MSFLRKHFLNQLSRIETGALNLITPEGELLTYKGKNVGVTADIKINDWKIVSDFLFKGDIGVGESYMTSAWDTSDLSKLLKFGLLNEETLLKQKWFSKIVGFIHKYLYKNTTEQSKKNISMHYDVGNDFYKLWLDDTMTYSSAIFGDDENRSLKDAQIAKYQRILDHFGGKNLNVLDIGCGWGGFLEQALMAGHSASGVTISREQYDFAKERLKDYINTKKAQLLFKDYRDIDEQYDAISSIGMFEHVGEEFWQTYMQTIAKCLNKGGTAMIQSILVADDEFDQYKKKTDFIRKHIFNGGFLPSVKRFKEEAAKAGLHCTDVFLFGKDYGKTLGFWLENFDKNYDKVKALGYDDAFIRKWRFYLAGCKSAFELGNINVAQFELRHA